MEKAFDILNEPPAPGTPIERPLHFPGAPVPIPAFVPSPDDELAKGDWDNITARFRKVRDALNKPETQAAYRRCYKKPWKIYRTHAPKIAIQILRNETGE